MAAFLVRLVVAAFIAVLPLAAKATPPFIDMVRYVFVPLADRAAIAVVDSRDDSLAGLVETGIVPRQVEIAPDWGRMAVVDGEHPRVVLIDLKDGSRGDLALDFVPDRLVMAGDGRSIAAIAMAAGKVAFIDLATRKAGAVAAGLGRLNDVVLSGDATMLYAAVEGREGLAMVDAVSGRLRGEIPPAQTGQGPIASIGRAPSGRVVYLVPASGGRVAVADLAAGRVTAAVDIGAGVGRVYTNAVGITMVLPDNDGQTVDFVAASSLRRKATLKGAAGMTGVYSGWFDTVTFIPSAASRSVLVFDQQGLERGQDIPLGGVPGRGTVTPDGRKLYLPLTDGSSLAAVNAETRSLAGTVALPGRAAFAVMGRTFGICH